MHDSKAIIDDMCLWYSSKDPILIYFECVYEIFQKYRVSLILYKCEFLKPQIKYVSYDILKNSNFPAKPKFNMISDWVLPTIGQSLLPCIGLVKYYHRYATCMEIRMKPLRKLCKTYYRKPIPASA